MIHKPEQSPVSVLMASIGGYGYYYLKTLLEEFPEGKIKLAGVVDPYPEQSPLYETVKQLRAPIYPTIEDFYNAEKCADLVVLSTPIYLHASQTCHALRNNTQVLCEKPAAATVQQIDEMIRVRDRTDNWVMIGYQWSYSKVIQRLKQDIRQGKFGKPIRFKFLGLWPKDDAYYRRNNWAGRIKEDSSMWVLDSPVNNALAHYLHNFFYLLGEKVDHSVAPVSVTAEVYRAHPIENYDTAALRVFTENGVEILFYVSHSTLMRIDPVFQMEFEDAVISYFQTPPQIIACDKKGRRINYGSPDEEHQFLKLFRAVEKINQNVPIVCGLEASRSQTVCMNGVQELFPEIPVFPASMVYRFEAEDRYWTKGLDMGLIDCYQENLLPAEKKYSWAVPSQTVDLTDYHFFPRKREPGHMP
ncbi:MAG TPA: Gfo/Idh/MocA family oxidoreductase [bacterium]|nr:Gfo/Idh/MocA family oxidoreductase [bacterium]